MPVVRAAVSIRLVALQELSIAGSSSIMIYFTDALRFNEAVLGKISNIQGKVFGRLTALSVAGRASNRKVIWECRCECGALAYPQGDSLRNGNTKSCGCLVKESGRLNIAKAQAASLTHGESINQLKSPEYKSWQAMKSRCYNPNSTGFHSYGGRGIKVCDQWVNDFSQFLSDMGRRPSTAHTLDRIEGDAGYNPSNCRWATPMEQMAHTSRTRIVTIKGKTMPLSEAIRMFSSVPEGTVSARISRGWDVESAILSRKPTS